MASESERNPLVMAPPGSSGVPAAPGVAAAGPGSRPRRVPWFGLALAVALLAASGAVRAWQSWGVNEALRRGLESPFPLSDLPMTLGDWKGEERELEPEVAAATGCTDHIVRSYRNDKTGSRVDLILLYGPTTEVIKHSPMICYPYAGFSTAASPEGRAVEVGGSSYPFLSMVFAKGEGDQTLREEVYFTWGAAYPGRPGVTWGTDMGPWKRLARIPGLYKVHLQRFVAAQEAREFGNPCEAFLGELMPWIDGRYGRATEARAGGSASAKSPASAPAAAAAKPSA
jgi:hypothetical protein